MKALIYSDNEQEYKDLKSVLEEELDGIIVKQILSDGHFMVRSYSGSRYREAVRRIAWETQYA